MIPRRTLFSFLFIAVAACSFAADEKPASKKVESERQAGPDPQKVLLSGKVVLLSEALARKKIAANEDELKGQVVLETAGGDLWPIVPDWRGRAFYQDKRLRDRPVDLIVYRRAGVPWLQVLTIYTFDKAGARQFTDYWCDICAIPMYEIKDCDCCQGPIRLRFQPQELPADVARESKAAKEH